MRHFSLIWALCQRYYQGVDLPIDDILIRSDLYDREGKYPHAFSFEANRDGDVRVLTAQYFVEQFIPSD